MNAMKVEEIADQILELCGAGASFEDILAGLFVRYNLSMVCTVQSLDGLQPVCTGREYSTVVPLLSAWKRTH